MATETKTPFLSLMLRKENRKSLWKRDLCDITRGWLLLLRLSMALDCIFWTVEHRVSAPCSPLTDESAHLLFPLKIEDTRAFLPKTEHHVNLLEGLGSPTRSRPSCIFIKGRLRRAATNLEARQIVWQKPRRLWSAVINAETSVIPLKCQASQFQINTRDSGAFRPTFIWFTWKAPAWCAECGRCI